MNAPSRLDDFRTFKFKLPWKSIALSEGSPVEIAPIVQELHFVKDKKNYGMAMRMAFRSINEMDFDNLSRRIGALNASSPKRDVGA